MEEKVAIAEARASLNYARISARKVKVVADLIRGKKVDEALQIVKFAPKASAELLEKLLKSAIANAENNHFMNKSDLYVAEIFDCFRCYDYLDTNLSACCKGCV